MFGDFYMAALTNDSKVFTWGRNAFVELEHGDWWIEINLPTKFESLDELFIVKIACGDIHKWWEKKGFFFFPLPSLYTHVKNNQWKEDSCYK